MAEAKKYGIVYADPPWRYDMKRGKGVAENHYPTMSMDEICALPVADLAAKDSALFLWATFPQLNEAFRVIEAWGFHYKTLAFLWLKQNRKALTWFYGLGFWTRSNAEICLLAKRGKPKRRSAGLTAIVAKTSAGAVSYMPVARVANIPSLLKDLKKQGIWVFGTAAEGTTRLYDADLKGPAAIVIGSEGDGMSRLVAENCDFLVSIPMRGRISSLNASAAAAILLYEAVRQRTV